MISLLNYVEIVVRERERERVLNIIKFVLCRSYIQNFVSIGEVDREISDIYG